MINYLSTRGTKKLYSFSEAILKGIADDGGLFVPEILPQILFEDLKLLKNKSYQERANFVLNLFQPDFSKDKIKEIVNKAYARNFDVKEIVPLIHLKNNQYVLELWHGPTSAFKDMALQIMPLFFLEAVERDNNSRLEKGKKLLRYLILVATSGDTGKAALEGYKDKKDISVVVFYPHRRVSRLQKLQMITQEGKNVYIYAVKGDFDATQKLVKDIFNDEKFNRKLHYRFQTVLSSANSINWGRLVPQIIYHISGYLDLINQKVIKLGDKVDIAVPTGNFGNILAAFYAKRMGLPIRKLICASNANKVLTEFLQTGIYDIRKRTLVQTPSPSMDILIASNIERLLYVITNNSEKVSKWMQELRIKGRFELDNETKLIIQKEFYADWVSNEECLFNIKNVYQKRNYLMDPHTSVAQEVAEKYIQDNNVSLPIIICSTAHWSKFAKDIYKALTSLEPVNLDEFFILKEVSTLTLQSPIPKTIMDLRVKGIRHKEKCEAKIKDVEDILINCVKLILDN